MKKYVLSLCFFLFFLTTVVYGETSSVFHLDGSWKILTDPENKGRNENWFNSIQPNAVDVELPNVMQTVFPRYYGLVWYWKEFTAPPKINSENRFLLRFERVDYYTEVWLNGKKIGSHEIGETPFEFDVTNEIQPNGINLLAVRVLNPTNEPIDNIILNNTPKGWKVLPFNSGAGFNHGGMTGRAELVQVPVVRVENMFIETKIDGTIRCLTTVVNAATTPQIRNISYSISDGRNGETFLTEIENREIPIGTTVLEQNFSLKQPKLWQLNDPQLYRATVRISSQEEKNRQIHEHSERFGFRDFRFENGYFHLNGKRIYLRCTHITSNNFPISLFLPHDLDLLRRDLLNLKFMGFNMVRFIWHAPTSLQLDICDEIGLMVYSETNASYPLSAHWFSAIKENEWASKSEKFKELINMNFRDVIIRDRNHPSYVIIGLLNETVKSSPFAHAVNMLPLVRQWAPGHMVLLNSGRWDDRETISNSLQLWFGNDIETNTPSVGKNVSDETVRISGFIWKPGYCTMHPGKNNVFSDVRWTAPENGTAKINAVFEGFSQPPNPTTTDVHILYDNRSLFSDKINLDGKGNQTSFETSIAVKKGDFLDVAVGCGNGSHGADTTGVTISIELNGKVFDLAKDFSNEKNPCDSWHFGFLASGEKPDTATFVPYVTTNKRIGGISNPYSPVWEDVVNDTHPYKKVPHDATAIHELRTHGMKLPLLMFLSEYGIGSSIDLVRTVRFYEQFHAEHLEDAAFYQQLLKQFEADWQKWKLEEVFGRMEDYFAATITKMAKQRTLGLNAIRSNPKLVGHSLTSAAGAIGIGEGLTTLFREMKPGTTDAIIDAWAPLRWCLFAEPVNLYRGQKVKVRLEAVLANEDVLSPGRYPVKVELFDSNEKRFLLRNFEIEIPKQESGTEKPPFAISYFDETIPADMPSGKYRFVVSFEKGATATGGSTEFFVFDSREMPPVESKIRLWGNDTELATWLTEQGIANEKYSDDTINPKDIILVGRVPVGQTAEEKTQAFAKLATQIEAGSVAIFLCPEVFREGKDSTAYLPLNPKGNIDYEYSWLYNCDEWARKHPVFDGLQSGGLLDNVYYRELISNVYFSGQELPKEAIAGTFKTSGQHYVSGLFLAIHQKGKGQIVLNTFRIRENLGTIPQAEQLLRNILRYISVQ
ncbi:MAG: hypothetical protein LBC02_07240 [Planctomycetaceae bacterium]|nr:hypothetical protein [Planctomycetaceae bacterium]